MAGRLTDHHGGPTGRYAPGARTDVGSEFSVWANVTVSLGVVIGICVVLMPGMLFGAVLAWCVWKFLRPSWLTIAILSLGWSAGLVVESRLIPWMWPIGLVVPGRLYDLLPAVSALPYGTAVWHGLAVELQGGPMLLLAVEGFLAIRARTLGAGIVRQGEREWGSGISRTREWLHHYASIVSPAPRMLLPDTGHPPGGIRLGALRDNRRKPFDLTMAELRSHVFIPGASGSGKTTTLARIADGALESGEAFVIVDCKGGGLGATARELATAHGLLFVVVNPDDPKTLGYNPRTGDGADVANKLLGAFSYGEEGEIYKQVAMRVLPVIVRGIKAAKRPVTLAAIADVCDASGLSQLGYDAGGDIQDELSRLAAADGVGKSGLGSLEYRFGALLQGKFGPLFGKTPALEWDAVLARPAVVYISLSATAASEDVELMGRVIAQDLKQLCARRLRAEAEGKPVVPVVCAFDEFAALREAEQITDLLLQARQAKMAVLLSTQYLPEAIPIRKAVLSAGLLVVHRLEAKDAEEIAAQFGTRPTWKVIHQIDWETGTAAKGSMRDVEEHVVHRNTFRRLPVGRLPSAPLSLTATPS
jgi:hypothetical protein